MADIADYSGLKTDLEDFNELDTKDYGELGYTIDGVYSVFVQGQPDKYNVRLRDGTLVQALHKGKVPPTPDLPVVVNYDEFNRPYIESTDAAQIAGFTEDNSTSSYQEVGFHTHHRGSGMEFPIDYRLFEQFYPQLGSDYTIIVRPGWYVHSGTYNYFPGETLDLTANVPASNGFAKWVVVYIVPSTQSLITDIGTDTAILAGLTETSLSSIINTSTGNIPIFAVKLKNPSTRIEDSSIVAIPPFMSLGGGGRGVIVTSEGSPVTLSGSVLRFNGTDLFTLST